MNKLNEQAGLDPTGENGGEPNGLNQVPTTHEAIFNHSRREPHAKWVWITKSSNVDKNGNLGFPALQEVRRWGGGGL
jgi:hypothetical protein